MLKSADPGISPPVNIGLRVNCILSWTSNLPRKVNSERKPLPTITLCPNRSLTQPEITKNSLVLTPVAEKEQISVVGLAWSSRIFFIANCVCDWDAAAKLTSVTKNKTFLVFSLCVFSDFSLEVF